MHPKTAAISALFTAIWRVTAFTGSFGFTGNLSTYSCVLSLLRQFFGHLRLNFATLIISDFPYR
jgi:hypothetical protein